MSDVVVDIEIGIFPGQNDEEALLGLENDLELPRLHPQTLTAHYEGLLVHLKYRNIRR